MYAGEANEANEYDEIKATVGAVVVAKMRQNVKNYQAWMDIGFFVPAGATYKINFVHWETGTLENNEYTGTIINWAEFR